MIRQVALRRGTWLGVVAVLACGPWPAEAGGLFRRRERVVAPTVRPVTPTSAVVSANPSGGLGTFYPTPVITVRGNFPTGGGYTPLDTYGDMSMDIYGPLSAFRSTAAPVRSYARGYDGRALVVEGTSFSTPNLPPTSPVVYPTQATYYYGFRESQNPPWWPKATNWIDQN